MSSNQAARALLDSNVIISALVEDHPDHDESVAVIEAGTPGRLLVAAHSYAEAFNGLTRRDKRAIAGLSSDEAWAGLERIAAATRLVGLSAAQTFDAIRTFAQAGGVGARLYDHLIGVAASTADADALVTWNTGHMRSLFPGLAVLSPTEFQRLGSGAHRH